MRLKVCILSVLLLAILTVLLSAAQKAYIVGILYRDLSTGNIIILKIRNQRMKKSSYLLYVSAVGEALLDHVPTVSYGSSASVHLCGYQWVLRRALVHLFPPTSDRVQILFHSR